MAMEERKLLESWKEIAIYLNRSVRTCKRWETEFSLPVHRLGGTPRAHVFAYAEELDRWREDKLHHAQPGARGLTASLRRKNKWIIGSLCAVLGLAALAFVNWRVLYEKPIPRPFHNSILAILPLENLTGDAVLESWRTAFPDLLITDLRQSRFLNVVPIPIIMNTFDGLKLQDAKNFSDEDLVKISDKIEADFTATGSLIKSAEDIIVHIFVHDSKTRELVTTLRASVQGEQALLDKADALSKEIKLALNLTPRQIRRDIDESVHRIATRSPQAFKLYSQALHTPSWEPYSDMSATLKRAIDLDPKFGMAYKLLYSINDNEHIEEMVRYYQKALDLSDRMSEREGLLLRVTFYQRFPINYPKMIEAKIPVSTMEQLRPKETGEALDILERLSYIYPDFFGDVSVLEQLSKIYMDAEEWDKAISVLEKGMIAKQRARNLAQPLIECYQTKGLIDKADKVLDELIRANANPNMVRSIRKSLAMRRRKYDDVLAFLKEEYAPQGRKIIPYVYFSAVGYIHWLRDDLENAEKAFQTIVDPKNLREEWQRSIDLSAVRLSQGKVGQALVLAKKALELTRNIKEFGVRGEERNSHDWLAYLYRVAGRLPEALNEAEEACREYENSFVPTSLAVKLLYLRALITLEMDRLKEFDNRAEELKAFIERERNPKLMRVYYHLLGLKELRQNRGHNAIGYFSRALDLFTPRTRAGDPSLCLFSLAEAYELIGSWFGGFGAVRYYDEISAPADRESLSGDIYARSFYRKAKIFDANWSQSLRPGEQSRIKALEYYRKFLSLWGNADPLFPEVADARIRLVALESK